MILILKVKEAIMIDKFCPISLSNFCYKIITKILADQLSLITMKVISCNQFGYIRNRNISHCIAIASKGINMLDKCRFGGNMALKFDIQKAFDMMDWNFIIDVLEAFDFSLQFWD